MSGKEGTIIKRNRTIPEKVWLRRCSPSNRWHSYRRPFMFFYEGYTCPVCGEKFKESDDIVACPECGAPHHRDCWKKEGHCHFVADHGTDRQWARPQAGDSANSAESAVEGKVCPHCGEKNPEFAEFCSRCGKDLPASDWSSVPPRRPRDRRRPAIRLLPIPEAPTGSTRLFGCRLSIPAEAFLKRRPSRGFRWRTWPVLRA